MDFCVQQGNCCHRLNLEFLNNFKVQYPNCDTVRVREETMHTNYTCSSGPTVKYLLSPLHMQPKVCFLFALFSFHFNSFYLSYFILFYVILLSLFYFVLFYFILFYSILFYFVLFYFILFYFILFYFILFCFVLFCLFCFV